MIVLGLETSCDETGLALYDSELGLRGQVLYSQIKLHAEYGGVVPNWLHVTMCANLFL